MGNYRIIFLVLMAVFGLHQHQLLAQTTISIPVIASSDDAEEQGANGSSPGSMDLTSSDLELVKDGNDGNQWVGMRFANINIPQGSIITSAYIQFTVDEDDASPGDKIIWAEDVDNATTFAGGNFNISSRTRTVDSTIWSNIPLWPTVGVATPDQRTADIANVVQAVINRSGWTAGNALNILINGTGERVAESYDGSSSSAPVLVISYQPVTQVSFQVNSSSDDAEEQGANGSSPGSMDLTSSDLELVKDGNDGNQWVGMRFTNINIPQGAVITNAYIQFTVDEDDAATGDKIIWAEDVDNATTFAGGSFNISSRTRTADSTVWSNIPLWPTVGAATPDQRTADIANVVQAVVNRSGWTAGNALNILMNGTGERVAESYDGSSSNAPVLVISYFTVTQVSFQVNSSSDDAEEQGSNGSSPGSMDLTSSDLELVKDGNDGDQWVGMRFTNINIPQGALITNAYIQFTVDEDDASPGDKYIWAEDVDDATTFAGGNFNISSRTRTADSVTWNNIPLWPTVGAATPDQRTTDITSVVQAVVNRTGWSAGNALNILMHGTGERVAESYDGSSSSAPRLMVSFATADYLVSEFPIASGDDWKYNDTGVDLGTAWSQPNYNDSTWSFGPAILGYNNNNETTVLDFGPDANNKYPTYYLRKTFVVPDLTGFDSLQFNLLRDDGAVVYVNGTEAFRMNMPSGTVNYNTLASNAVGGSNEITYFEKVVPNTLINNDTNLIAVELHQSSVSSSDLSFDMTLVAKRGPIPVDSFPLVDQSNWLLLDTGVSLDSTNWTDMSYPDATWDWGPAPLGYNDFIINTTVSFGADPSNKHITTYFRKPFYVDDVAALKDSLLLSIMRDDAAIVYINGTEVARSNMPAAPTDYLTVSTTTVAGADETSFFPFILDKSVLQNGMNQIAVEVHQRSGTSSDLIFDLKLEDIDIPTAGNNCPSGINDHIGCFTSIERTSQTPNLIIPSTHNFQMLFQQGDTYTNGTGTAPGNNDFTGYVAKNGSSIDGYVSVNHETTPGGVSIVEVQYDSNSLLWSVNSTRPVDFTNNDIVTTTRNCSGGVTPWGTIVTSEETFNSGDLNNDGYTDVGWNVEIDPVTAKVKEYGNGKQEKLWKMGRMAHENVVVSTDNKTAYYGEDGGSSCVFKYVADTPTDLSEGTLYVLKLDAPLVNNEPTAATGQWIMVPNTTQNDMNNTRSLAIGLGGTNFNGVEDLEINPLTGQVYFTSKGKGRVYRFTDGSTTISNFETFVGGQSYFMNSDAGFQFENWGGGNDNLTFDDLGNLWVLQDGGRDYIWVVRPDHTQEDPKVELFMSTPAGSEPTGMTFSPDHKFMFVSIQHPSSGNTPQEDATGNNVSFNVSSTIVIARKEFLGVRAPMAQFSANVTNIMEGDTVTFTDNSMYQPTTRTWTFNGGNISTSSNAVEKVVYNTAGTYDVKLEVGNGQGNDSETKTSYIVVKPLTTGIESNDNANKLNVYPNPVNDILNVEWELQKAAHVNVELYGLNGALITTLFNDNLSSGNYKKQFNVAEVLTSSQQLILVIDIDGKRTSRSLIHHK